MYLKVRNKKLEIVEYTSFIDRFKSLKFVFEPIDYIIKFPKKKKGHTYFFVQKVDVIQTDKDEKIVYLIKGLRSEEKIRRRKGSYNLYFAPLGTVDYFDIGDKLKITEK